jgi:hypothetical protein
MREENSFITFTLKGEQCVYPWSFGLIDNYTSVDAHDACYKDSNFWNILGDIF